MSSNRSLLMIVAVLSVAAAIVPIARAQPACPGTKVRYQDQCMYPDEAAKARAQAARDRPPPPPPPAPVFDKPTAAAPTWFADVAATLAPLIDRGRIGVDYRGGRMIVWLPSDYLFAPRSGALTGHGRALLAEIADTLGSRASGRTFVVAAHTDNTPAPGRFGSPRELAAAQALATIEALSARVDARYLLAVASGDMDPLAPNDTADGRARNRRIEIEPQVQLDALLGIGREGSAAPAATPLSRWLTSTHLAVMVRNGRMLIRLAGDLEFAAGSAAVSKTSLEVLGPTSEVLRSLPVTIRVVGHTSSPPLRRGRFASHRALAMARAFAIADRLPGVRTVAGSLGELDPVADNKTKEGRRENDRVDLELVPDLRVLQDAAP